MPQWRVTSILSIQSSVAYGHVGNSAVTFPLMRLGIEVWPVLTVHFSNHTEYPGWRGPMLAAADIGDVIQGIDDLGVLAGCDAVLSGYQGAEEVGATIVGAVELVQRRNPAAVYCCDPVMGDVGKGFFVRPGVPEFIREHIIPRAQIITPNQFELDYLTTRTTQTPEEVLVAADVLRETGPDTVLVTSVVHDQAAAGTLDMIAVDSSGAWSVTLPLLPGTFTGAGDLTSALFLAGLLTSGDLAGTLAGTAAVVHGILAATVRLGQSELQLVAAQDEIVNPTHEFPANRLR